MRKPVLFLVLLLPLHVKLAAQINNQLRRIDQCLQLEEYGLAVRILDSAYSSPFAKYKIDSLELRKQIVFQKLNVPEWTIPDTDKMPDEHDANFSGGQLHSLTLEELKNMRARELASILKVSVRKYEASQYVLNRIRLLDFVYSSDNWFIPEADGETYKIDDAFASDLTRFQDLIEDKEADALSPEAWLKVEELYAKLDAAFLNTLPLLPTKFPKSSSDPPITLENGKVFPQTVGSRKICLYDLKQILHRLFIDLEFREYQEIQYYQANDGLLVLLNLNSKQVETEIKHLGVSTESNVITDFLIEVAEWVGARATKSYSGQVLCSFSRECRVSTSDQAKLPGGFTSGLSDSRAAAQTVFKDFNELSCTMLVYFRRQTDTYGHYETLGHSDASGFLTRICLLPRLRDQNCPKK